MRVVSNVAVAAAYLMLARGALAQPIPPPAPGVAAMDFAKRELAAPPPIKAKLQELRALKAARNWTFDPVYTTALDRDLKSITGAIVPPNFGQHVRQVNARALARSKQQQLAMATNTCFSAQASFDWRQHAGATPVRDQGSCGSCWIFGAHGALEGSWRLTNDASIDSSEQNTLDCNFAGYGCGGGWPSAALDYLSRSGSATQASYAYAAAKGTCRAPPTLQPYWANNWGYVGNDDAVPSVMALKTALCHYGPLSVGVNATAAFQAYGTNQVFNERASGAINHIVTLIGWDDAKHAWLIKNSWGAGWGDTGGFGSERGYMWIDFGSNKIGYGAAWAEAQQVVPPPVPVPLAVGGLVHLQDIGDVPLRDATWAGTIGQSRRLEGFAVNFTTPVAGLGLEYMCHLQGVGDVAWMPGGSFCGTRGQSRRLEGLAIRLTGPNAGNYDVFYACHLQDLADVGPVKNGAFCGTRGQSRRLEAMEVWVAQKPAAPVDPGLTGLVHLQDVGDQPLSEGVWAGTKGQGRRLEGFQIALSPAVQGLGLEYMCHLQDLGDQPWMAGGAFCGTRGQSRRLEGLGIRLTGENASKYEVSYSCHLQGIGDVGPLSGGAFCGSRGQSRRLEAVNVAVKRIAP